MSENTSISTELLSAVKAIKTAILQSQYRAAKSVNREQLSLYFGIGWYNSTYNKLFFTSKLITN